MSTPRDYRQFCGLAAGLNVIGNRWTLLIIRELLLGPARFNELLNNLSGIGPNLLAERLQTLSAEGVIEPSPVDGDRRGKAYRLTERGHELKAPLLLLARWGLPTLTEGDSSGVVRPEWAIIAVEAMLRHDRIPDVDESYEFVIDDTAFVVEIEGGAVTFRRGASTNPSLRIVSSSETFVRIGARMIDPFEAVVNGQVAIEGDDVAMKRCLELLDLV